MFEEFKNRVIENCIENITLRACSDGAIKIT
jgi:hypothetical protein